MLFAIVMLLYYNLLSKLVQEPLDNANNIQEMNMRMQNVCCTEMI